MQPYDHNCVHWLNFMGSLIHEVTYKPNIVIHKSVLSFAAPLNWVIGAYAHSSVHRKASNVTIYLIGQNDAVPLIENAQYEPNTTFGEISDENIPMYLRNPHTVVVVFDVTSLDPTQPAVTNILTYRLSSATQRHMEEVMKGKQSQYDRQKTSKQSDEWIKNRNKMEMRERRAHNRGSDD